MDKFLGGFLVLFCLNSFSASIDKGMEKMRNDCIASFRAHAEYRLTESEEKKFKELVLHGIQGALDGSVNEIRFIVHALADFSWAKNYVWSSNYLKMVNKLLEVGTRPILVLEPYNQDVKIVFEKIIQHQIEMRQADPLWESEKVCRAISDASSYFLIKGAFGLVQHFETYADSFKCPMHLRSWKRVEWDKRFKK